MNNFATNLIGRVVSVNNPGYKNGSEYEIVAAWVDSHNNVSILCKNVIDNMIVGVLSLSKDKHFFLKPFRNLDPK